MSRQSRQLLSNFSSELIYFIDSLRWLTVLDRQGKRYAMNVSLKQLFKTMCNSNDEFQSVCVLWLQLNKEIKIRKFVIRTHEPISWHKKKIMRQKYFKLGIIILMFYNQQRFVFK